ncbi:hypothetical protein FRC08_001227 [Ceratobasidium sp. 394]|nr:hypothetical protein FRC08_001227 [Ceratobasidium sp. 394]KAG9083432.1 hypothetical protein FS749_006029 [Ceratobasidium sp. UAMH 11750]
MSLAVAIPELMADPGEQTVSSAVGSAQGTAKFPERAKNQQSNKVARTAAADKRKLIVCIDGTSNQFSEKVVSKLDR